MPQLPPDLHNAVVDMFKPEMVTLPDRQTILRGTLRPETLQNRIDWTKGNAFQSPPTSFTNLLTVS